MKPDDADDGDGSPPLSLNGESLREVWADLYGVTDPEEARRRRAVVHEYRLELMAKFDPVERMNLGDLEPPIKTPTDS